MSRTQDERLGSVIAIDNGMVQMIDHATGQSFEIPLSAPGGVNPIPGDQWICRRLSGFWAFDRCVGSGQPPPQRSFLEVMERLVARGLIDPSFIDGSGEAMHLAYIGEVRWFAIVPNDRWVPANGAPLNRVRYRELAQKLDPEGDGETFAAPTAVASGTVQPYVCARK